MTEGVLSTSQRTTSGLSRWKLWEWSSEAGSEAFDRALKTSSPACVIGSRACVAEGCALNESRKDRDDRRRDEEKGAERYKYTLRREQMKDMSVSKRERETRREREKGTWKAAYQPCW